MRMARSTGALSGLLIVVLGLWGALVPFVGPYFNYAFGVNSTWHYTSDRLWLCILPGALAVAGGLLLMAAATRPAGVVGGWLALVAGAWFAIGPAVSLTWESGQGPIGRPLFGSTRQMLELLGYFYGLGALIVALAAFAIGRFASRPALAEKPAAADGAPPGRGAAPAAGTATPWEPRVEGEPRVTRKAGSSADAGPNGAPAAEPVQERPRRRRFFRRERPQQSPEREDCTPVAR
jgi:hypothetical protein